MALEKSTSLELIVYKLTDWICDVRSRLELQAVDLRFLAMRAQYTRRSTISLVTRGGGFYTAVGGVVARWYRAAVNVT